MPYKLNIYIIHVDTFAYRKATCEKLKAMLESNKNFDVTFTYLTEHDPGTITPELVRQFVDYDKLPQDDELAFYNNFIKNMHINHLSNILKHRLALQAIASQDDDKVFSIVLEDDIIFNDNVAEGLMKIMSNLPTSYDILFLGLPSAKDTPPEKMYQKLSESFKILPCCDSYHITKTGAEKLLDVFKPVKFSYNIHLSYLLAKTNAEAYSVVPNVFVDGSKLGLYFSSLEVNNRLVFNQEYVALARLVTEKNEYSPDDIKTINKLFEEVKLKTNPEFYYLKAKYEEKRGNFKYALAIYEFTYDLYDNNGAILNNQCTFLRDYIRVFKHLQHVS